MPKAVVIEFIFNTPLKDWNIVANNSHGNTVKSTFLNFAGSEWDCDVRLANYGTIYALYDYVARLNETPYDLAICSWRVDDYFLTNLQKIVTDYGIPLFMPASSSVNLSEKQDRPIVFVGANDESINYRLDTWDIATNLSSPNSGYTSYTTAVVAGKSTLLLDAGFTALEVVASVREQSLNYPTWDNLIGYGKAPELFDSSIVPTPAPEPDPIPDPIPEPPYIPNSTLKLSPFFL